MKYPTFLQYIETLSNPRLLTRGLGDLRLCRGANDEPIYSSGNFGVVFKVMVEGEVKALKCFTRVQPQRSAAYSIISQELSSFNPYILNYQYLEDEITVFEGHREYIYPLLLMDWVEGETLTNNIRRAIFNDNSHALRLLSEMFDNFAVWLLQQPFAHGDLKPDNIMIREEDGELAIVDYDGMFMPQMEGWSQRELGTPEFQHPCRAQMEFSKSIDNYSLAIISLSLKLLAENVLSSRQLYLENLALFSPRSIHEGVAPLYNQLQTTPWNTTPLLKAIANRTNIDTQWLLRELSNTVIQEQSQTTLVAYKENNLYGFTDQLNRVVIPAQFDQVTDFNEGLASISQNKKWGFINQQGSVIVPPIYDFATPFRQQRAVVAINGKYGFIDNNGCAITKPKYDNAWSFSNQRGMFCLRGKYGYIDPQGNEIIKPLFNYANTFCEGFACVKKDDLYGYINQHGKWVVKPSFTYAKSVRDNIAEVENSNGKQLINTSLW